MGYCCCCPMPVCACMPSLPYGIKINPQCLTMWRAYNTQKMLAIFFLSVWFSSFSTNFFFIFVAFLLLSRYLQRSWKLYGTVLVCCAVLCVYEATISATELYIHLLCTSRRENGMYMWVRGYRWLTRRLYVPWHGNALCVCYTYIY